jgi:hypothetical protein
MYSVSGAVTLSMSRYYRSYKHKENQVEASEGRFILLASGILSSAANITFEEK